MRRRRILAPAAIDLTGPKTPARHYGRRTRGDVGKRFPDGCIKRREGKLFAYGEFHEAYRHGPGTPCSPDS